MINMKRKSAIPSDQPKRKVKKDLESTLSEESSSDEDCQIVFVKPSPAPEVDASFENLEVNNNSEEVRDEIDMSVLCLEDDQPSRSVLEISSKSDNDDGAILIDKRNTEANAIQTSSGKRVKLQSFPCRKKFKSGPSKFEKRYDSILLDKFLCARSRSDKVMRKDKMKQTFVEDEDITFKFKRPEKEIAFKFKCFESKLRDLDVPTDLADDLSQNSLVDLTVDDEQKSSCVYPPLARGSLPKTFEPEQPVESKVPKNPHIASSRSQILNHSPVYSRKDSGSGPSGCLDQSKSDVTGSSTPMENNTTTSVTDSFKPKNVDATKNIHVMNENVVLSYGNNDHNKRGDGPFEPIHVESPLNTSVVSHVSSISPNFECSVIVNETAPLDSFQNETVVDESGIPETSFKGSRTMVQEVSNLVHETEDFNELYDTAFKCLEV